MVGVYSVLENIISFLLDTSMSSHYILLSNLLYLKRMRKLNRYCTFWRNGLHWFDGHGVGVLVEIVDESQCVLVLMSCEEGYSDNMVRLRRKCDTRGSECLLRVLFQSKS